MYIIKPLHAGGVVQGAACVGHISHNDTSTTKSSLLINARYHLALYSQQDALESDEVEHSCPFRADFPAGIDAIVHLDAPHKRSAFFLGACSNQCTLSLLHWADGQLVPRTSVHAEHRGPGDADPRTPAQTWRHAPPSQRLEGALLSNVFRVGGVHYHSTTASHVAVCLYDDVIHMVRVTWTAEPQMDVYPLSLFGQLMPAFRGVWGWHLSFVRPHAVCIPTHTIPSSSSSSLSSTTTTTTSSSSSSSCTSSTILFIFPQRTYSPRYVGPIRTCCGIFHAVRGVGYPPSPH